MTFKLFDYQKRLVDEARQAFLDGYKFPVIVSPCGSGKSVVIAEIARLTTERGNKVLFLVHRRELIEQIKDTFTKSGVVMENVRFGMVMTIRNHIEKGTIERPDLIITDESHHALAKSYRIIYDYFKHVPKLGFTATPIRLNQDGLGDVNDFMITGQTVQWLIDNNRLSPFKYYAPGGLDKSQLKLNSLKEFSNTSIDKAMKSKIYGDAVKHYKQLADGEQAIAYCHSIESSIKTAETFNEAGINAAHIDGKTPKTIRDEIIEKFRTGEIKVLSNVEIIGEGFDVPDCSTVILLRPTKSLSLYIQMAMRGMRYRPNKTSIIIDHVDNVSEHGLPNTEYKWSLHNQKRKSQENTVFVKTCTECFATWQPSAHSEAPSNMCPMCGHVEETEAKETELEVDETAELEEKEIETITLDFRTPDDCNSMSELYQLAKNKGYKPGWAYIQGKRLGFIK